MKKILLFSLAVFSTAAFAYTDIDMDGVDDTVDKCPNTPFMDLVDISGCSKVSLVSPHHFDVIAGISYADSEYQDLTKRDTLTTTLQADYYYKNFSIQASTSYYSADGSGYSDSGLNDSFIGAAYQIKALDNLFVRVSAGALLPTYDTSLNNNNTDYVASMSASYNVNKMTIFGGYSYTIINDDDVTIVDDANVSTLVNYQDTSAYNLGLGYHFTDKLYLSGSYNISDSVYKDTVDIETASLYGYYGIDNHWFMNFSYAYGLSDSASDNYASVRLGYFF